MKPEPKTPTFVAVSFFKDAKDFKVTNDVFNGNPQASKFPIGTLCRFAQGFLGWFTLRCLTITVEVLKSLIASVTQDFCEFKEVYVRTFEELKVMLPSFAD